jgi:hypothetical protein
MVLSQLHLVVFEKLIAFVDVLLLDVLLFDPMQKTY